MASYKYVISGILILATGICAGAQDIFESYRRNAEDKYGSYESRSQASFDRYRDRINSEFASYLKREWEKTSFYEPLPEPEKPGPKPVPTDTAAIPSPLVPPAAPVEEPAEPLPSGGGNYISFTYLGNLCRIRMPENYSLSVRSGANKEISDAWSILSGRKFDPMLSDFSREKEALRLCDWAFLQLLWNASERFFGDRRCNEAIVFQAFVLSQSGYKVRLGKTGGTLHLLVAFKETVFSRPYIVSGGDRYFCFDGGSSLGPLEICDFTFPNEKSCSLIMDEIPRAGDSYTDSRVFKSADYPSVSVSVSVNRYLVSFYDEYPSCSWEIQAACSLSREVKDQVYPKLKEAIRGLSELESANLLLNFVQTGFEYMTDEQQFGREKSFFGDESFWYPYCDCEDRSILFSILVRDLLGLDVVLLDFPAHIATAVRFNANVPGDHINLDEGKYVICDPTYIGASVGQSMSEMADKQATILRIS